MQRQTHRLFSNSPGTTRELVSLHYGRQETGRKAYLHASLHADEPPGMLVLYHLRRLLDDAEAQQRIAGSIVLVPVANPIGLSQRMLHQSFGRFEFNSAENFNRNYPDLVALLGNDVIDRLGTEKADATANRDRIRKHLGEALAARQASHELDSLRLALVRLAFDADIVLDLHCDNEGVMHLYTETPYWRHAEPLARYLGARVSLLAEGSGSAAGGSFDEALSGLWWRIPRQRAAQGEAIPVLPLATFSATVELRGQTDVNHDDAKRDATALFQYLVREGLIEGQAAPMPALLGEPTPLAGSIPLTAPHGGVVVFRCAVGVDVEIGTPIADIVEPMSGTLTTLTSPIRGCLYARSAERMVQANQSVARIAGPEASRQGALLGP
jgi:predicted deacylase